MGNNKSNKKKASRRDTVYQMLADSPEASGASGASTSKMAEYQTPQQQHTRPPIDKKSRPRKSFLQQEIDDDNLNDEVPRVTKAQETFNDIPNPTPAEIGRMLSGRIDYVQSRHAHHFDEMERCLDPDEVFRIVYASSASLLDSGNATNCHRPNIPLPLQSQVEAANREDQRRLGCSAPHLGSTAWQKPKISRLLSSTLGIDGVAETQDQQTAQLHIWNQRRNRTLLKGVRHFIDRLSLLA